MITSAGLQLGQRWVSNFPRWDKDNSKSLSIDEVFGAIASPDVAGEDAAALATLYREINFDYHRSGGKAHPLVDGNVLKSYLMRMDQRGLDLAFASYNAKINGAPVEGLNQGISPSCALVSAAYSLNARDDAALSEMVRQDDSGYHVKFPGVEREVHFQHLTDTEKALHTSGLEAIEKAWGILEGGSELGAIAAARGNGSDRPITALTGHAAATELLPNERQYKFLNAVIQKKRPGSPVLAPKKPLEAILAGVKQSLANGAVVTTGTWSEPMISKGLQHSHAYTVLGCEPDQGTVTLRNPYGRGEPGDDGKNDGIFTLSASEYVADFNSITIETGQPGTVAPR